MSYISRLIITMICSVLVCVFGSIYCLFSPRSPKHVATFEHMFGHLTPFFGLEAECRKPTDAESYGNATCIANRQSNYDMMTASNIVQPPTVTVGKESLLWIPFFGQLYWLTGNLLVDRNNRTKAHDTIAEIVNHFKKRRVSIWVFLEGTHGRGRGLLPFKTGVFHTTIATDVPIVPVCVSTISNKISLNRLHSGLVIVEMLPPINTGQYGKDQVCELTAHCRSIMEQKTTKFDKEVAKREAVGKAQVGNPYFCGGHFPARYYFSQSYME